MFWDSLDLRINHVCHGCMAEKEAAKQSDLRRTEEGLLIKILRLYSN